jgi:hypothetical protein
VAVYVRGGVVTSGIAPGVDLDEPYLDFLLKQLYKFDINCLCWLEKYLCLCWKNIRVFVGRIFVSVLEEYSCLYWKNIRVFGSF